MSPVLDLVQESKLETQFYLDQQCTQHAWYVSGDTSEQRKVRQEERWRREKKLESDGGDIVWLEKCIQGNSKKEVRAVKKIKKSGSGDYYRELKAIALFSHSKIRLFLYSFVIVFAILLNQVNTNDVSSSLSTDTIITTASS
jgi:hypothetical protein